MREKIVQVKDKKKKEKKIQRIETFHCMSKKFCLNLYNTFIDGQDFFGTL